MTKIWFKIPPPLANSQEVLAKTAKQAGEFIPGEYIVVFKDQWEGRINNEVGQEALQFVNNKISKADMNTPFMDLLQR